MRGTSLVLLWIIRIGGIIQIVVGLLFWTGRALNLLPMHMLIGLLVALSVLLVSILAWRTGGRPGAVIAGVLLALALPALGMTQMGLLVGSWHWIIRVLHLAIGVGALGVGDSLANYVRGVRSPERAPSPA